MLTDVLNKIDSFLWGPPIIITIIACGLYLTVISKFFTFRHFGYIMKNTFGKLTDKDELGKTSKGKLPQFQAICTALGGCVGCGTIAGVAGAIAVGGPGAVFWMWVWAFFGMTVKAAEIALACYYRSKDEKGNYYGGPTYYMEKGLKIERGWKIGGWFAWMFGLVFMIQGFSGSQAYTISEALHTSFGIPQIPFTICYAAFVFFTIWKGVPRIAKVASKVVPFACTAYLIGGLIVMIVNISAMPGVFKAIFMGAFTGTAATGAFVGAAIKVAVEKGLSRAINANEAGMGSSPMTHARSNTPHPIRQGIWGSFEVFTDTVIVCSITALAVLSTGQWTKGYTSATLVIESFKSVYGVAGVVFIGIIMCLFGFSVTTGWFSYYESIIAHGFRNNPKLRDRLITAFKIIYPFPNILIVTSIVLTGSGPNTYWTMVDIVVCLPTFVNVVALVLLSPKYLALLKDYKARYMGIGKVDPNFKLFYEDEENSSVKTILTGEIATEKL